ncbi:hypothetical protein B0H13DRAFT_1897423 [Mycena leptocephala]|nr:hypothetical protein B0H13DRAFT_1897423 [Mycena leptocephala]
MPLVHENITSDKDTLVPTQSSSTSETRKPTHPVPEATPTSAHKSTTAPHSAHTRAQGAYDAPRPRTQSAGRTPAKPASQRKKESKKNEYAKSQDIEKEGNESTLVSVKRPHDDDPTRPREVYSFWAPKPTPSTRLAHAQRPAYAQSARLMLGFVLGLVAKPNATRTRSPHAARTPHARSSAHALATLFKPTSCTQSTAPGPTNAYGAGPQAQGDSDFASLHPRILAWRIHNERGR